MFKFIIFQIKNTLNILNSKNLIFITNYLQLMNSYELISKKKIDKDKIIIITNEHSKKFKKNIKFINKIYNIKKEKIFYYKSEFELKYLFLISFIFKKFNSIIVGNLSVDIFFYWYLVRGDFKASVDDGTSRMVDNIYIKKSISKKITELFIKIFKLRLIFFSSYRMIKKNNISFVYNNYDYLRKLVSIKQKKNKKIIILGSNLVTHKIISNKNYKEILINIKKRFSKKKIFYYPHPRENIHVKFKKFLKLNKIKIISNKLPFEMYYLFYKNEICDLVSFNSSAFVVLKILLEKKQKLYTVNIDKKLLLRDIQKYRKFNSFGKKEYFQI